MRWERAWVLALALVAFWGSSCVTADQYQRALDEKDSEIRGLREERADLKAELQDARGQVDELAVQVSEASARVPEAPARSSWEPEPGLAELGVGYGMRNGMVVITLPSAITFPSGSAELSSEGRTALKQVASVLKRSHADGVYHIEGHTDTDPIRKSKFANNRELSLARAMAVLAFLVQDCRISDDRCVVVGHGQYRPIDPASGSSAKAKNRRVEIVVHGPTG